MKKSVLRKYATLIATVGVNVQKGQEVFIAAELDQPEFVKMVVEECYRAGAKRVVVDWDYQPLTKLHVRWRSQKNLSTLENWEKARWQHYVDEIPSRIYLISEDPDGLTRRQSWKRWPRRGQAKYKVIRPYRDQIENKYQWCIAAVPGVGVGQEALPEPVEGTGRREAVGRPFWPPPASTDDPVAGVEGAQRGPGPPLRLPERHSDIDGRWSITARTARISSVGMIRRRRVQGRRRELPARPLSSTRTSRRRRSSSPRSAAWPEGIVYSTKPLSYQGQLIENFSVRFEGGKAVEVHAEKNEALLQKLISMDEGAAYLGECALVPYNSPDPEFRPAVHTTRCSTRTPPAIWRSAWALPTRSRILRTTRSTSAVPRASTIPWCMRTS